MSTPSERLRAALYTIGGNLMVAPQSSGAQLFQEVRERRECAASMERNLRSGVPGVADALLRAAGGSNDLERIQRLIWSPVTREDQPDRFAFIDMPLATIRDAEDALRAGGAARLAAASGGSLTAEMLGADLREATRLLTEFAEAMAKPAPLPAHVPSRIVGLAGRFTRAADLLTVQVGLDGQAGDDAAAGRVRLETVLSEFSKLTQAQPDRVRARVHWAIERYVELGRAWVQQRHQCDMARYDAVLAQLRQGRIVPREPSDREDEVQVDGWFPPEPLARLNALVESGRASDLPALLAPDAEAQLARAAIPIVERMRQRAGDPGTKLPPLERPDESWVEGSIKIMFVPPAASEEPLVPIPTSLEYIRSLPAIDILAISYAQLAALHDLRAMQPFYRWPTANDGSTPGNRDDVFERHRLSCLVPASGDAPTDPDPTALPPHLAEQMLALVRDDLTPGRIVFKEGQIRTVGDVSAEGLLEVLRGELDLFIEQVHLWERTASSDFRAADPNAGPLRGGPEQWERVVGIAGMFRGIAIAAANPLTPEQVAALDRGEVVAHGPLRPARALVPLDDLAAQLLFMTPVQTGPDGVPVVRKEAMEKLRQLSRVLGLHAGESPAATPDARPAGAAGPPSAAAANASDTRSLPPRLRRPIPVCEVAAQLNIRSDNLLTRIRRAKGAIDGNTTPKQAEYDDIRRVLRGKHRRQFEVWASENYPPAPPDGEDRDGDTAPA